MPQVDNFPFPHRYNTLRLLGFDYTSIDDLCALTLVTDRRRPLFADTLLAKRVLTCLLSDLTLQHMYVRAFTLMPDHLHLITHAQDQQSNLARVIGQFKSFTTQVYWKRSRDIVGSQRVSLPSGAVRKTPIRDARPLLAALADYAATLRPEVVELKNWPKPVPNDFRGKNFVAGRVFRSPYPQ